jgi:hypothetical protein
MVAGVSVWSAVVGSGLLWLGTYAARPGEAGTPPGRWPSDTALPLDTSRPTLLMFFDPRCPCSAASLMELRGLVSQSGANVTAWAVTCGPEDGEGVVPEGVGLRADPALREARRFGVRTSGQVLMFEPSGRLVFRGGITPARGHQGASYGREAVLAAFRGEPIPQATAPVFGCALAGRMTPFPEETR